MIPIVGNVKINVYKSQTLNINAYVIPISILVRRNMMLFIKKLISNFKV